MSIYSREVADILQEKFAGAVQEIVTFRGEITVVVDSASIIEIATYCRDTKELGFNLMADLAAVDYWPKEPRFAINYVLYSLEHNHHIRLKTFTPGNEATLPTMTGVYPGARWPEREVWDMFGITFEGHPDPRRILMPYDWQGHPQRKDYPLGYEEVQFSFNYEKVMERKPHPKK